MDGVEEPFARSDIALLHESAKDELLDVALALKFRFGDVPIVHKPYFSCRECEVMALEGRGMYRAEIARCLDISRERVKQISHKTARKSVRFRGRKVPLEIAKEQSRRFHGVDRVQNDD